MYLVFDDIFNVAGRVRLPSIRVFEVGAGYVLGLGYDDRGIEEVVLFALRR